MEAKQQVRRGRRWRGAVGVGLLSLMILAVWTRLDSQAVPKTVDLVRGIVGDRPILFLEDHYYRARNSLEEATFARDVARGSVAEHPAEVAEVLSAPAEPRAPEPGAGGPADLGGDPKDEQAGRWLDKGLYLRTHVYPEPKVRSVCDLAWIKPGARLHVACGSKEPARSRGRIHPRHLESAFLAFSGGFQYRHLPGGIRVQGRQLRPMRDHLGTLVVYTDDRVEIGKWQRDWQAVTPDMRDLRQCLLLIDRGDFNEGLNYDAFALSRAVRVYRSALGVTAAGNLVYAAGNGLSAAALARTLLACGVVQALHLDMNYGNATCGVIQGPAVARLIQPLSLRFPDPSRFLETNYRDFMYLTRAATGA